MSRRRRLLVGTVLALAVSAAPAAGAATPVTISATEGQPFAGQLGSASCPPAGGAPARPAFAVAWGDGQSSSAQTTVSGQQIEISGTHTYAEEGSFAGSVSGTYACGDVPETFTESLAAQVADAPLSATGMSLSGTAGQVLSGAVATFTDANLAAAASDYGASIDWGDGSPASTGSVSAAGGGFTVTGAHAYASAGSYTATVTITDAGGSRATATTTVTIGASTPPGGSPSPAGFTLPPRGVKAGTVALFGATGSRAAGYGWTVHGPGVLGGSASVTCGPGTSELQTSFGRAGPVAVTLRVTDASGASSTVTHVLAVAGGRARVVRSSHVPLSQWFLCLRGPGDPVLGQSQNGGPPPGCQDEYFDGLIDMVGCLTPVEDFGKVPAAEQAILKCQGFIVGSHCFPAPAGKLAHPAVARLGVTGGPPCRACQQAFSYDPPFVVSTQTVRVNGLDVAPAQNAAVVLDYDDGLLASSNAEVSLLGGLLPISSDYLRVATFNTHGDIPLLDTSLDKLKARHPGLGKLLDLAGFNVGGTLTVDLGDHVTKLGASLTLPGSFTDSGGKTVRSAVTLTADNPHGLMLDDLIVRVPNADFGGTLQLDHVAFCYQQHVSDGFCQKQTKAGFGAANGARPSWNATAEVNLLGYDINAVPPPPTNGIGFVGGNLAFAGLNVSFPDPGIPLGDSGLTLNGLGASFGLNPTRLGGSVQLGAADILDVEGDLFMVFASPASPYSFTGGELGPNIENLPTPTVQSFALAAGGDVGLNLPVIGRQDLGNGYDLYVYPGYFAFGGHIHFDPFNGLLTFDATVSGQLDVSSGAFDVEASARVHIIFLDLSAGVVLSSTGVGACGTIGTPFGPVSAGGGYRWGGNISVSIGSCDLGSYRANVQPSIARGAGAGSTLTVPRGLPSEMVKVIGSGGAPQITISGPGGIHATSASPQTAASRPFLIYRVPQTNATYIAIIHPRAGAYRVTADAGSPPITEVLHADGIRPSVGARVVRRHGRLRLVYRIRRAPGQHVIFLERGRGVYRRIASVTAAHGAVAFTPAPGLGGRRQILAQIVENGAPVMIRPGAPAAFAVAAYTAPVPRRLGRVARLSARHLGTRVLIGFRGVRGAHRYAVIVTLSSGQRQLYVIRGHRLAIHGVAGEISGAVTVRALGDGAGTRTGPSASARFRPLRGE